MEEREEDNSVREISESVNKEEIPVLALNV